MCQAVVGRTIAASTAAMPVQVVAEAVAFTVTAGARVVELAQVVLLLVKDLRAQAIHNLEEAVTLAIEHGARLGQTLVFAEVVVEDLGPRCCGCYW